MEYRYATAIKFECAIKSVIGLTSRIDEYSKIIFAVQFELRTRAWRDTKTWISSETWNTQNTEHAKYQW